MRNCENCIYYRLNKAYTRRAKNGAVQTLQLVSCTTLHRYIAKQYNERRALLCRSYKEK